jgi:EamA domain-containing membrane protein RarD
MTPIVVLALLASAAFASWGDYLGKRWVDVGGWKLLVLAILAYEPVCPLWLIALKRRPHLGQMATIWCIVTALVAVVMGIVLFDEKLTRTQWAGVALGLASLPLLGAE